MSMSFSPDMSFCQTRTTSQAHMASHTAGPSKGLEPAVKGFNFITSHSFLKLATVLTALTYASRRTIGLLTDDGDDGDDGGPRGGCRIGEMCPTPSGIATSTASKVMLVMASALGGALIAGMVICMFSKCYATRYFLHHSWIQLIVDFEPTHDLHTSFGMMILGCGLLHGILHTVRFVMENSAELLYTEVVNRSGVAATLLLLILAVPMAFKCLRDRMTFEFRKALHIMFLPFLVAMCFHTPLSAVIFSVLLCWYLLDRFYFTTRQTFLIDKPVYKSVGRGTLVRIDLPSGYEFKAGSYAQVNCPAICSSEWHPFSLFPVPGPGKRAGFHVEAVGDWTRELFRLGLESPQMPLWITAAQPSSIEKTLYFENVLLVCTGAGITPAVSAAERFARKKNIHLLWMSREASMIAMFEKQLRRVKSTVHVTGSPSKHTKQAIVDLFEPTPEELAELNGASEFGGGGGGGGGGGVEESRRHKRSLSRDSNRTQNLSASSRETSSRDLFPGDQGSSRDVSSTERARGRSRHRHHGGGGGGGHSRNTSVESNFSDMTMLEAGLRAKQARLRSPEMEEKAGRGSDEDDFGLGSRDRSMKHGELTRSGSRRGRKRVKSRGLYPVSVKFGRPDISGFIRDTVQFNPPAPTTEWPEANLDVGRPAVKRGPRLAQVIERLNTGQRISKENLMQADIAMVQKTRSAPQSRGPSRSNSRSNLKANVEETPESSEAMRGNLPWLVVYSGANGRVERAISSVCEELKITWRKEYFSTW